MNTVIEFTDRYGSNPPSWLRGCFGCEAMGYVPTPPSGAVGEDGTIAIDHPGVWTFERCPSCHGTGSVPVLQSVTRIPRWVARGIPFVWRYGIRREFNPGGERIKSLRIALWSAWGADIRRLRR